MENENDILSKIPLDMPAGPYLLGYAQAVHDLNKDWELFRREAAKAAMLGILAGRKTHQGIQETAEYAVKYADELIKQLKEGEK